MPLLSPQSPTRSEQITSKAKTALRHARDTYEYCLARYNGAYDALWGNDGWTIEDAQQYLDDLGPGVSAEAFQANYQLGLFLNAVKPGTIEPARLAPPVAYTAEPVEVFPATEDEQGNPIDAVMGLRIVLDPSATYPA